MTPSDPSTDGREPPAVFVEEALATVSVRPHRQADVQEVTGRITDVDRDEGILTLSDQENPRRIQVNARTETVSEVTEAATDPVGDVETVRFNAPPALSREAAIEAAVTANHEDAWETRGVFKWYSPEDIIESAGS